MVQDYFVFLVKGLPIAGWHVQQVHGMNTQGAENISDEPVLQLLQYQFLIQTHIPFSQGTS